MPGPEELRYFNEGNSPFDPIVNDMNPWQNFLSENKGVLRWSQELGRLGYFSEIDGAELVCKTEHRNHKGITGFEYIGS